MRRHRRIVFPLETHYLCSNSSRVEAVVAVTSMSSERRSTLSANLRFLLETTLWGRRPKCRQCCPANWPDVRPVDSNQCIRSLESRILTEIYLKNQNQTISLFIRNKIIWEKNYLKLRLNQIIIRNANKMNKNNMILFYEINYSSLHSKLIKTQNKVSS